MNEFITWLAANEQAILATLIAIVFLQIFVPLLAWLANTWRKMNNTITEERMRNVQKNMERFISDE